MNPLWAGEQFEVTIHFSDFSTTSQVYADYVVRTDETIVGRHIGLLDINFNDGNRSDNPLGTINSSYGYINIFDTIDALNPLNENSAYAGIMRPGVKITINKINTHVTPEESESYFSGYISKWNTSFSNGINGYVSLSVEDKLNLIGLTDTDDIDYSGTNAADAFNSIFTAAGLDPETEFIIDPSINLQNYEYDTLLDGVARNTLNDLCRLTLSYLTVKHDGKIYLEPLIVDDEASSDLTIPASYIGSISLRNTNAVNYTEVKVSYPLDKDYDYIGELTLGAISANSSKSKKLTFDKKVYSIEDVALTILAVDQANELIDSNIAMSYTGSKKKIKLTINNSHGFSIEAKAKVYGLVPGGDQIHVTDPYQLPGSSLVNKETFTYDSSIAMDEADAEALRDDIGNYIVSLRRLIDIKTSFLTPDLEVGNVVTISALNSVYNGKYRVSSMHITFNESYNVAISLLKI